MSDLRPSPPRPISSPCVMVCAVDGASGLCLGCYRTLGEIAEWSRMGEENRQKIMQELPSRAERIDPKLR
ncbi:MULTISPECIES: DUF1289 domain-containing protein [unclassified Brevundimonas]|uniref:DUF1289 domain-containing protein n=1 Tax=unclassified Brevundimonas TaxID=2622653 RepID=UPI0025BE1CEA|nr:MULTISPECIES: DUF1289 domain-containing protein [unclassified Brevundimonas]